VKLSALDLHWIVDLTPKISHCASTTEVAHTCHLADRVNGQLLNMPHLWHFDTVPALKGSPWLTVQIRCPPRYSINISVGLH